MHATFPAHLVLVDLIAITILKKKQKLLNFSLRNILNLKMLHEDR